MPINYAVRIQQDNRFRFWISLFIFLVCVLLCLQNKPSYILWSTLLFVSYAGIFSLGHLSAKRGQAGPVLQYLLIATDVYAITSAIYLTGGLKSPLYILYIVLFGICLYHQSLSNFVYAVVLSFSLYAGLLYWQGLWNQSHLYEIVGQFIVMGVLTGVLTAVLILMAKEKKRNDRWISRTRTLAHVSDILSGSLDNPRHMIRKVSHLIENEVQPDGLSCRIVIHRRDQPFLPPSSGKVGVRIPILAGEIIYGTLVVTRSFNQPLNSSEQDFFSSLARSMGLSLHRAQLWDDLHKQLKKIEANLLLDSSRDPRAVKEMIQSLDSASKS